MVTENEIAEKPRITEQKNSVKIFLAVESGSRAWVLVP